MENFDVYCRSVHRVPIDVEGNRSTTRALHGEQLELGQVECPHVLALVQELALQGERIV